LKNSGLRIELKKGYPKWDAPFSVIRLKVDHHGFFRFQFRKGRGADASGISELELPELYGLLPPSRH
jgi:hypothetical protein